MTEPTSTSITTQPSGPITALGTGSFDDMQKVAKELATSGLMGTTTPAAVFGLMLLCQCEGIHPVQALRRFHLIEGKPSMRADAMLAEFQKHGGGTLWHARTDEMVAVTFFSKAASIDDQARKRASERFSVLWDLSFETDGPKFTALVKRLSELAYDGEETILRTFDDCEKKGMTQDSKGGTKTNWLRSPRQMLTARCITEGIRLVMPGLITGIYETEEVRDIIGDAPARTAQTDRAESDIAHMKATVEEYRKKALDTSDPTEKRRLLGLASDLAGEVQMLEDKSVAKPVKSETAKAAGTVPDGDDVPMKPAIEAKIDHVEPPAQKATAAARSRAASEPKPEPGPFGGPEGSAPAAGPAESQTASSSASPEPEWMSEPLPTPDNWKEYRIRKVTAPKWFGKKLGELAENEISALWRKRGEPLLNSQDVWFKAEAQFIKMAWEAQGKK